MKRMHSFIVAFVVGLGLCGLFAVRHRVRPVVTVPPVSARPPTSSHAMDAWQGAIKADGRTDYTPDPAAKKRLMQKLHQEAVRQRPQEGRN